MTTWKFTCYNGTTFEVDTNDLHYAIGIFIKETGLHILDIKRIENLS